MERKKPLSPEQKNQPLREHEGDTVTNIVKEDKEKKQLNDGTNVYDKDGQTKKTIDSSEYLNMQSDEVKESEKKAQKILEEKDRESGARKYSGKLGMFVAVLAICFSLFHLYILGISPIETLKFRMFHVTGVVALIMLIFPAHKGSPRFRPSIFDWLLFATTLIVGLYSAIINIDAVASRGGGYTKLDVILGAALTLLILEAARRTAGRILVIISLIFIAYAFLGPYLPGILRHGGFSVSRVSTYLYMSADGLMGITTGVSATYVFLFCLFGAFLAKSGMTQFFNDFAVSVAGASPGGPAKVAVLCSGLVGMVSGSSASNVATTGPFTIPLMKRIGYPNHFAGAVEAVASTAGQITPPVMGAGAFIMAEFLGISYSTVALAALLPCVLYYVCCWVTVHFRARKLGMQGVPRDQLPKVSDIVKAQGYLVIPLLAMIVLLCMGYTATYAAVRAIVLTVIVSWIRKATRMSFNDILLALKDGATGSLSVCISCIVVCTVVGMISLTGLGTRLGVAIIALSHGYLFPALLLTMVVTIILGMGLPTSAAYIITASVSAPILVRIGVMPLAAHFFVFYFAILAGITPPVAVTAYIGAGIADADPLETAITSVRLAIAGVIVPFMFVYSPELLLQADSILAICLAAITATVGAVILAASTEGFLFASATWWIRVLMLITAMLLIKPGLETDIIGAILLAVIIFIQKNKEKKLVAVS